MGPFVSEAAQLPAQEKEVVVVHPDGIALFDVRGEKLGETRIDLLVDSLLGPVQVDAPLKAVQKGP